MGGYGLVLCANESYTDNLAIGINFDHIAAYTIKKKIHIVKKIIHSDMYKILYKIQITP